MEQYDLWKLDKKLQKEVDEDRYHHTLGVMFTQHPWRWYGARISKKPVSRDCFTTVQNAFRIRKKITMCEKK